MKKLMMLAAAAVAVGLFVGCEKQDDTIKMITEATFPPYEFLRGQEIAGIDVEICKAVAARLGKKFQAETVDFDSVIPAVISGKADLAAAGITITEDRKKNVDFSDPYVKTGIVVIFKKSNPFRDKGQLKGKKIGVQAGTTSETFVTDQLKQEPERSKSPSEAVAALKAGRVEFVIADIDPAKNCVKGEADLALSDFITSEEYAIAIRKGQPELLKAINETIAEIKADGRLAKWIADFTAEADKLKDK
ncbi:MAG: amino acid ABC transporter substrate-binding protein [Kiritimatiellae bacterium]|nr:amino acid ABC transporter substrate-binding protein [Kiritimatiellia bacterium]